MTALDRRGFLGVSGATGALALLPMPVSAATVGNRLSLPDEGWRLWLDREARFEDDRIVLPSQVDLAALPVNPPTGGWSVLDTAPTATVTLPTTVEEHLWGKLGERPYTDDEYRYANDDPVPRNGAYRGVSWWVRDFDAPASFVGRRVLLHLRGARLRAEVFLNEALVGYSIMAELPIVCDLTTALRPGARNRLAIRITNPGGRYDWRDSTTMTWGAVKLFRSHGFGGIDRDVHLTSHPLDAHFADAWVLNTPQPRVVTGHAEIACRDAATAASAGRRAKVVLLDAAGARVRARVTLEDAQVDGTTAYVRFRVEAPTAKLWDLADPALHTLRFACGKDVREVRFGFRWFSPEGLGSDALLRLNGRRIKLYSAISWGYWGFNGLWPRPELAVAEVKAAKALGLNCLHFHRNVGKREVLDRQDEMGLLRVMEPGGGRFAIAGYGKNGELSQADRFARDYQVEKCVAMVRAFRSHPSLVQYSLQNELGADLSNPDVQAVLLAMHRADPSRTVILNDGFVARGASQAMYLPYGDKYYRSDETAWGGWWDNHQGAGDQWYDAFYKGPEDYIHRQTGKPFIVEFGEMEGCAVADDHAAMVETIRKGGGRSYDLADHAEILANTEAFLDRWGFRKAFPTAQDLFLSIGRKCYDAWANYMENIRIGDEVDVAAISGWETTAIENHSGIVDNLRGFKSDPALVRASLLPVRPVAKQRRLAYVAGENAMLDLYLFNDTAKPVAGDLVLTLVDPQGAAQELGRYPVAPASPDRFSQLVAANVATPALAGEGEWQVRLAFSGAPDASFARSLWVTALPAKVAAGRRIAVSGIARSLRAQLETLPGLVLEDFRPGRSYDLVIASGLKAAEIARRQVGEQTGLEAQPAKGDKPKLVPGELSRGVLAAVRAGLPLLALVPEDGLSEGVARQLAALGLLRFDGTVGDIRAPWMGNWNYLRAHPLFAGIPADRAAGIFHQVDGRLSNGLLVDGPGVEIVAGYSRDHDRRNGAATLVATNAGMRAVLHRMPDMAAPLQRRFLANAIEWLAGQGRTS
ncbi:MAG TPA: hypothetical protein VMQ93_17975 [Novosphingobium sp.]|nr:hypothetical protein [Novosphingobium sp.]